MTKHPFLNKYETTAPAKGTKYYLPSLTPVSLVWKNSKKDYAFLALDLVFLKKVDAAAIFAYRFV